MECQESLITSKKGHKVEKDFCILSDPHEGHFIFISFFTGMISSNLFWHFKHLNSYIGIFSFENNLKQNIVY